MAWESTVFKKTRCGGYKNCMALLEAYAERAPLWQRLLLAAYVGLGPPVAHWLGGNTKMLWRQADSIIGDLLATSAMSPADIVSSLCEYLRIKRNDEHHLEFTEACRRIYDQRFYPLVTHFTFALQPSAVARMRFVKRIIEGMPLKQATVADLGCGSGMMLTEILALKPEWTGFGLDISQTAIDYARRLAIHKGIAERVHFQTGSLSQLPFADESLDLLVASEVVEHLPERGRVFLEFARVLTARGVVLVTMPLESYSPAHLNSLGCAEELRGQLEAAGLTDCRLESKWHLGFGDDSKHVFAVARNAAAKSIEAEVSYAPSLPQISIAASSGIISS